VDYLYHTRKFANYQNCGEKLKYCCDIIDVPIPGNPVPVSDAFRCGVGVVSRLCMDISENYNYEVLNQTSFFMTLTLNAPSVDEEGLIIESMGGFNGWDRRLSRSQKDEHFNSSSSIAPHSHAELKHKDHIVQNKNRFFNSLNQDYQNLAVEQASYDTRAMVKQDFFTEVLTTPRQQNASDDSSTDTDLAIAIDHDDHVDEGIQHAAKEKENWQDSQETSNARAKNQWQVELKEKKLQLDRNILFVPTVAKASFPLGRSSTRHEEEAGKVDDDIDADADNSQLVEKFYFPLLERLVNAFFASRRSSRQYEVLQTRMSSHPIMRLWPLHFEQGIERYDAWRVANQTTRLKIVGEYSQVPILPDELCRRFVDTHFTSWLETETPRIPQQLINKFRQKIYNRIRPDFEHQQLNEDTKGSLDPSTESEPRRKSSSSSTET